MPVSAIPSIVSGANGSPVLVEGSPCVPATALGAAVGAAATGAAVGAVVGATVGVAVATETDVGVAVAPAGVAVAATVAAGVVAGTGVAMHPTRGPVAPGGHVGSGGGGGGGAAHVDLVIVSLINVTFPVLARSLPSTVEPFATVMDV